MRARMAGARAGLWLEAVICGGLLTVPTAAAAATTTDRFFGAGTYSFTVPAGVTVLYVAAVGGAAGRAAFRTRAPAASRRPPDSASEPSPKE